MRLPSDFIGIQRTICCKNRDRNTMSLAKKMENFFLYLHMHMVLQIYVNPISKLLRTGLAGHLFSFYTNRDSISTWLLSECHLSSTR